MSKPGLSGSCPLCGVAFANLAEFGAHMKSEEHKANAAKKTPIATLKRPEPVEPVNNTVPSAQPLSPAGMPPMPTSPCKFFASGLDCRNAWRCGFLHSDTSSDSAFKVLAKDSGVKVENVLAIDVECVATGKRHDDRAVCSIAVINSNLETIYFKLIKPSMPIVSYLTPVTGFKTGDLDKGIDLDTALRDLHALLGPEKILVGQAIQNDVEWTKLEQGKHFTQAIDIAHLFKTTNTGSGFTYFYPLLHTASVLLPHADHDVVVGESHDPIQDAKVSMQLYLRYAFDPRNAEAAKQKLAHSRAQDSVAKRLDYQCDGVCMAAYHKAKCFCGAPVK